ncbi:hydroxymethylglutaryl-CoA reductase, degradative [Amphibacillus sp. MSJ-3]|uniref:hydroxymethylglutaryl-CoA reductase, degradative n=1 Tax=Amphibacillus sp. MSJ-3 TaxID=2841505 RepID=UPI001C0E9D19|nr:hydroxymethylglutaryl-CoA reductase, degradative [Amphibacillus sp. MSJ-3]MBU5594139.1 hydroxymethylglutaryl-CoA reductase, degradative [Amphibacillus sp. MSJ-3]
MRKSKLDRFYQRTIDERIEALIAENYLEDQSIAEFKDSLILPAEVANHMIENQIGTYHLPLGLGLHFLIDGNEYLIPMATEEPSVIAAACFAAKTIRRAGGFTTEVSERVMIGQIALKDIKDKVKAIDAVKAAEEEIITIANEAHPSIVKRGGGACNIKLRWIDEDIEQDTPSLLVIHLHVKTLEAMGANIINTMVEAVKPYLESITDGKAIMGILSNYATECLATARCHIPVDILARHGLSGIEVRDRIIEASQFAIADPYRAVTNNKGIMNGIDALVIATGNDSRAIEAGAHAYAARSGQYRSLSKWTKADNGDLLGELSLPLPVGTVGGSISIHPGAKFTHQILGFPDAKQLESIIVSLGLAQNFAAIRALVTDGIQKGHMALQAKSLAISSGATGDEIQKVARALRREKHMNLKTAREILLKLREDDQ